MTDKHTPGPWKTEFYECDEDPEDNGWLICHPRTECPVTVVCKVDGKGLDNAADAALIARAPELLEENEALKARIAELEAERTWQPIETAPRNLTKVLLYHPEGGVVSGVFDSRWRRSGRVTDEMPTHWMPLPKMEDE